MPKKELNYYNKEIKQLYLETAATTAQAGPMFSMTADYERKADLDFGAFSREEALKVLNTGTYINAITAKNMVTAYNSYRAWYIKTIDPSIQPDEKISLSDLDFVSSMRRNIFLSLDDVFSEFVDYDNNNGDEAAPAAVLLWYGFKTKELLNLKESQVDYRNGLIFDSRGDLICRDLDPLACSVLKSYKEAAKGTRTHKHDEKVYAVSTGYFIHKMDTANGHRDPDTPTLPGVIHRSFVIASKKFEQKTGKPSRLTALNIYYSGSLYRVHSYLKTNPDLDTNAGVLRLKAASGSQQYTKTQILFMHKKYVEAFNLE